MEKLVVLDFYGDFEQGFRVDLSIGWEQQRYYLQYSGTLPAKSELIICLEQWRESYALLEENNRIKPKGIIYGNLINSRDKLNQITSELIYQFQNWLESPLFASVDRRLREELNRRESVRLLLCSNNRYIHLLPWSFWDLVERYPKLEIALSNQEFELIKPSQKVKTIEKVKILAILGSSQNIELEKDCQLLQDLPDAEVVFLVQPQRQQLNSYLWEQNWDLVFFAGHSQTTEGKGLIYLNEQDTLCLEEIKFGFKKAIASGLKLAIFNSCDGLGLAYELSKLSLPQMIIMREPVPDRIAQEFLTYFLTAFSSGKSLYLATRYARERLQGWENIFPCASWLPVIYQNPAVNPPTWQTLLGKQDLSSARELKIPTVNFKVTLLLAPILATVLIILMRSLAWLQPLELSAFDFLLRLRPIEPADNRILVVTVDEQDLNYQQQQGWARQGSLSDTALQLLIEKIKPFQPKAIASDLIHDFPFSQSLHNTVKQTDDFFGICRVKSEFSNLDTIKPPPDLPTSQLGFSNLALDPDDVIRRQILGMSPDRICQSDRSLSYSLALHYLDYPPTQLTPAGLKIGNLLLPQLKFNSGGYNLAPKETQGYQILINYRANPPQSIGLRQILQPISTWELEKLIKNRIIWIGVIEHNQDLHPTPYAQGNKNQQRPGVFLHAQMASQIISAAKGERTLLWWLPEWLELIWISFWSVAGLGVVWINNFYPFKIRAFVLNKVFAAICLLFLFSSCYLSLLLGAWIPLIPSVLAFLSSIAISQRLIRHHRNH